MLVAAKQESNVRASLACERLVCMLQCAGGGGGRGHPLALKPLLVDPKHWQLGVGGWGVGNGGWGVGFGVWGLGLELEV
jgi:hypothetical protein